MRIVVTFGDLASNEGDRNEGDASQPLHKAIRSGLNGFPFRVVPS